MHPLRPLPRCRAEGRRAGAQALRVLVALASLAAATGCARRGPAPDHYLRWTAFEVPVNENVLLRWERRHMPLRVHLPAPPADVASDPEAVLDAVRDGVTDWTDLADPGIPSFEFVEDAGDADIPIVWDDAPSDDYFVAHCVWMINWMQRRFGVAHILVTTHWREREVSLDELYAAVLHEMGHALGLRHSPDAQDVMYPRIRTDGREPTARDRETLRLLYSKPIGHRIGGARHFED